jgi:phytoene/squalene synthetase
MSHRADEEGLEFGHEFHGHEHHFRVTREALEYLSGGDTLDVLAMPTAYNAHRDRIHALAERLSRTADGAARIVLAKEAFERD